MESVLNIAEIEKQFEDEWVLVGEPQTNETFEVLSGQVLCHGKTRDEVYRKAMELRPARFAVIFTGEMPAGVEFVL
jgi:hypothetical protein